MTSEKKKLDTRKIIYRKLREQEKKTSAKISVLIAVAAMISLALPGICNAMQPPSEPWEPVNDGPYDDADVQEPGVNQPVEPEAWPPKPIMSSPGISGGSTHTFHI